MRKPQRGRATDRGETLGPVEEGEVSALGRRGEGILRDGENVVFLPGAVPGERARFRRLLGAARGDRAVLDSLIEPHPGRRDSPCEHDRALGCGQCTLLSIEPPLARELALAELQKATREILGLEIAAVLGPAPGANLRHAIQGRIDGGGRWVWPVKALSEALNPGGPKTVRIENCKALHPRLEELRKSLMGPLRGAEDAWLRVSPFTGERMAVFTAKTLPPRLDPAAFDCTIVWWHEEAPVPLRGHPWMRESLQGVSFRVGAYAQHAFDPLVEDALAAEIQRVVTEIAAQRAVLIDAGPGGLAYAGFAHVPRAILSESDGHAFADLDANATELRRKGEWSIRRVEGAATLRDLAAVKESIDLGIFAPSRKGGGTAKELLPLWIALRPKTLLVLESDLRRLAQIAPVLALAGYRPVSAQALAESLGRHEMELVLRFEAAEACP